MQQLENRALSSQWGEALANFFNHLHECGSPYFHPHELTHAQALELANYKGLDCYYIAVEGGRGLGYGMLRGWEKGYPIPSIGIAVHAEARGTELARTLVYFLHMVARRRGAPQVRLKVDPENKPAVTLYQKIGCIFRPEMEAGQYVGFIDLA